MGAALPVVDVAIRCLRVDPSGEQRFVWGPRAEEALGALLEAIFLHPADPRAAIDDLLRLSCALELEMRSPRTAARLVTILRLDPRVLAACNVEARSHELREAQQRWSGAEETKAAPRFGARPPPGTISAAELLRPLDRRLERRDARRSWPNERGKRR